MGISEARRLGNKIVEYEDFILCHTGETPGMYGVGFIIKKYLKQYLASYIGISERVALLQLDLPSKKLTIIQAYAPTEAANEEEITAFYENIYKAMDMAYKDFILMGDFNAKIGQPRRDEHIIMKQNGYGERNARGQILIDFALENKLSIVNTFYKKNLKRRWTWRSPSGEYKNEIDYILTNRPQMIQNIETLSINYPSDHRPLRTVITLTKPIKSRANYNNNNKYSTLKTEQEILLYRESLKNYIPALLDTNSEDTVQKYHDKLINSIQISLRRARDTNLHTKNRNVLSERTKKLIKRRQELQKTSNKTRTEKNELKALYKVISKYIKTDYKKYRRDIFEKHLEQSGSVKKGFKELR